MANQWAKVLKILKTRIDTESFATWFDPEAVKCRGMSARAVWLETAGEFYRNWLANNYLDVIGETVRDVMGARESPDVYFSLMAAPERAQDDAQEAIAVPPEP